MSREHPLNAWRDQRLLSWNRVYDLVSASAQQLGIKCVVRGTFLNSVRGRAPLGDGMLLAVERATDGAITAATLREYQQQRTAARAR